MSDELSGPHLSAAFLCEQVLQEKDGVLSFIRVVDRFVRPKPGSPVPSLPIQVMMVIGFKAGGIGTGKCTVKIRMFKPSSAAPAGEMENEVFFEGGQDQGVTIANPFILVPDEEGLYWIEILVFEKVATRVPFRVIFAALPTIQVHPPTGG
jgi:hypothetical protein